MVFCQVPAIERISSSKFTKVVVSNSLEQGYKNLCDKIDIIDISWMCGSNEKVSLGNRLRNYMIQKSKIIF